MAYGLKDVTTLVTEDNSFTHPELEEPIDACLTTQTATSEPKGGDSEELNFSAAELSELAEVVRKVLTTMNA